jgi:hypothetical protein
MGALTMIKTTSAVSAGKSQYGLNTREIGYRRSFDRASLAAGRSPFAPTVQVRHAALGLLAGLGSMKSLPARVSSMSITAQIPKTLRTLVN